MANPTYQSTISALTTLSAQGGRGAGAIAYQLLAALQSAVAAMNAAAAQQQRPDPSYTTWLTQYTQSAAETDRAARFCVTQLACSGSTLAAVTAAFGVASLGTPAALAIDTTSAINASLVARVAAAQALVGSGASPVNPAENVQGMSTWLTTASAATSALWSGQPPGNTTGSPAYAAAVAAVAAANANGAAFVAAGSFT